MAASTAAYDLTAVTVTPWAPRVPRALGRVRWHRVGRDVCVLAGLLAFLACTIALRLSLDPQSMVSSRTAVLLTLLVGTAGIGAFFAARRLRDAEHR